MKKKRYLKPEMFAIVITQNKIIATSSTMEMTVDGEAATFDADSKSRGSFYESFADSL